MKVRKAATKDLKEIDAIYVSGTFDEEKLQNRKLKKKNWEKIMKTYQKERVLGMKKNLKNKKHYWIIAEENKEITGFGQVVIINKSQGELEKLYINKNYRNKGIASKIEKILETWLKNNNINKIYSRILLNNKPSIQFHMKKGFKQTAIKMEKNLK